MIGFHERTHRSPGRMELSASPPLESASAQNRHLFHRIALLGIALASVGATLAILGLGALSLPGLGALALLAAGATLFVLHRAPGTIVLLATAVLPLPFIRPFLPFEFTLLALLAMVLVLGIRRRADWTWQLQGVEVAYLVLILWAAFTGLWCTDARLYLWGLRKLATAIITFWVAYRLAHLVPRRLFEWSIIAVGCTLSLSAMVHWMGTGLSNEQALLRRATATDLGWGTANYIAGILLLISPMLLRLGLDRRRRALRAAAWPTLSLIAVMQVVIASRAGLALFWSGTVAQLAGSVRGARRWAALGIGAASLAILLIGPWSKGILNRFTSLRELGSMTVRIWYFREAWRRTLDTFPWGFGANQGQVYPDHLGSTDPHNYWLVLSSELGIPGVVAWIIVLIVLWRRIGRLAKDPEWRNEARALQVIFWLAQIHTLVEPTFQGSQYQFVFFWIIGGSLGYHAVSTRSRTALPDRGRTSS